MAIVRAGTLTMRNMPRTCYPTMRAGTAMLIRTHGVTFMCSNIFRTPFTLPKTQSGASVQWKQQRLNLDTKGART